MDEFIKELQKEADISTCSPEVQKGIRWLENREKYDRGILENELKEKGDNYYWKRSDITEPNRRLKSRYVCESAAVFYLLSKINSPLVKDYLSASENEYFWHDGESTLSDELYEDPHILWYLAKFGLTTNRYFQESFQDYKSLQTVKGEVHSNKNYHTGFLRVLVLLEPTSKSTDMAVEYFLDECGVLSLGIGILALTELNYFKYKNEIEDHAKYLKSTQTDEGFWGTYSNVTETSYNIQALSRTYKPDDTSMLAAIKWLKKVQKSNGSWENNVWSTSDALLALMAAGEGPKGSLDRTESKFRKFKQFSETTKPLFVHTSPIFHGEQITEIKTKIEEMINRAKKEVRISSLRVDDLYGEIQNAKKQKPELDVKILLKKGKVSGERKKIAGSAIEILKDVTNGNVLFSDILHSRSVIIDNDEVLVSSADLDHTQLNDEFNAGIWTRDKETVQKAIEFFDNIWNYSTKEKQEQESKKN